MNAYKLSDLLEKQPPVRAIPDARSTIRKLLEASGKRLVVADDDPTGTQTVHENDVAVGTTVERS